MKIFGTGFSRFSRAAIVLLVGASLMLLPAACLMAASTSRLDIGSRNVASAAPQVSRPSAKPCVVQLFSGESFDSRGNPDSMSAHPRRYRYAPPKGCRGAWSKVVLEADFSVSAGRQFDRTTAIWLGGVNLFFGTTVEPSAHVAPHWHIERDLTDYASLFRSAHPGQIILNNWVSPKYTTSAIRGSARLLFYPAGDDTPAARSADRVYALSDDRRGEQTALQTASDSLSRRFTFPRTMERVYLDVIAQSQSADERWYTCIDDNDLEKTRKFSLEAFEACDGGNFREIEVLVDHQPAGLAPVYPWTYTGGVAPHLWLPTPDIQALNFKPARVDLTPFAGLLDDGHPHTISVRILGAHHFFNVAANVLVYLDHGTEPLKGRVTLNTLAKQAEVGHPSVHSALHRNQVGHVEGMVDTDQSQTYTIAGRLNTAQGTVVTTVSYAGQFHNAQTFKRPSDAVYHQHIHQWTTVSQSIRRVRHGELLEQRSIKRRYPLSLDVRKKVSADGGFTAAVAMDQGYIVSLKMRGRDHPDGYTAAFENTLSSHDEALGKTIPQPISWNGFAHHQHGQQRVSFTDSMGSCYRTALKTQRERLVSAVRGHGCPSHANHLMWRSRPGDPQLIPILEKREHR